MECLRVNTCDSIINIAMESKEKLLIKFLLMSFVDIASLKSEMEVNRWRPKNKLKTTNVEKCGFDFI